MYFLTLFVRTIGDIFIFSFIVFRYASESSRFFFISQLSVPGEG